MPGLVVVFAGGAATTRILDGVALELGRDEGSPGELNDSRVSRRHAEVALRCGRWLATDLASKNGTFVDGQRIRSHVPTPIDRVVRVGGAVLVPCNDIQLLRRRGVRAIDGLVYGPAMQEVVEQAERAARAGTPLHIRGETGSGKEGIAAAFHRATGRVPAAVTLNCATIPPTLAERLLFGTRRGAFSGAEEATGHLQEADGSTLFLDEIAELELAVQAKLLRVLESREVVPLGATRARAIDFALCTATHKDLRALVAAGRFREDLYFRIALPTAVLPPLRDRAEEIPSLMARALLTGAQPIAVHASLVELCLLRPWPGNVRELLAAIAAAAARAAATGDDHVAAHHLADDAGMVFGADAMAEAAGSPAAPASRHVGALEPQARIRRPTAEWRPRILAALQAHHDNKAAAARALSLHVTELRRLIKRCGITEEPDGLAGEPGSAARNEIDSQSLRASGRTRTGQRCAPSSGAGPGRPPSGRSR